MNSLEAMCGCGLNFFIKLAYNSLFLYKFASVIAYPAVRTKEIRMSDLASQGDVAIRPSCRHIS